MAMPMSQATPAQASEPAPFRVVLLATDLSPTSMRAEDEAVRLAAALRARLVAISVIDPGALRGAGGRFPARVDQVRGDREAAAQGLVSRARAAGVSTHFLVWTGDPGESILDAAEAEAADIIVLGTHGRRGLDRSLFGSVSDHVVRHAPCPVVVIRGPG
jgi:nucleotide-binding universal stress UspA family protein